MADLKISELPALSALTDADLMEVVQALANKKMTGAQLKAYLMTQANIVAGLGYAPMENDFDFLAYQAMGSAMKGQALTGNLAMATTNFTVLDANFRGYAVYVPKDATITGIKVWQRAQGNFTADNNNRVGLYSESGGVLTLIASSTNDGTLWQSVANGVLTIPFSSPIALAAGKYYIGMLANWSGVTTSPTLAMAVAWGASQGGGDFTNNNRLNFAITSQTDLPASITLSATTLVANPVWAILY